eukprot:403367754
MYADINDKKQKEIQFKRLTKLASKIRFNNEACWCIANIGITEHVYLLKNEKIIKDIIKLLYSKDEKVVESSIWALANISGEDPVARDLIINSGCVPRICRVVNRAPVSSKIMDVGVWALSNFCKREPPPQWNKLKNIIPVFVDGIFKVDKEEPILDLLWGLMKLTEQSIGNEYFYNSLLSIERFIDMATSQPRFQFTALKIIGNLLFSEKDDEIQIVIDQGVLKLINKHLNHEKQSFRNEVMMSFQNISTGNRKQIQACFENGLYERALEKNMQFDIKYSLQYGISVLANTANKGSFQQVLSMLELGAFRILCETLIGNHINQNNQKVYSLKEVLQ